MLQKIHDVAQEKNIAQVEEIDNVHRMSVMLPERVLRMAMLDSMMATDGEKYTASTLSRTRA